MAEQRSIRLPFAASVERQTVVILQGPAAPIAAFLPVARATEGLPAPRHTRVLFATGAGITVERLDLHTLRLRPDSGYLALPPDQVYRNARQRLKLQDRVELTGCILRVTGLTPDGRPAEITCRFSVPLEHPSLLWIAWEGAGFTFVEPPGLGEKRYYPPPLTEWWKLDGGRS